MREVLGFSTAGGGKPLKGETVTVETSEKMDNSATNFSVKPSNIPGYLDLTPEQASRLIKTEPLSDYYDVEEEPFARGKYAAVRRCRHKTSGRQFAAKFLRKRRRSSDLRTEIIHEVAVLESCKHTPRVVRLHEVYESSQEMVLLLELACGGELQMLLDKDEVPSEHQVLRLMRQILDGLMHLHSINVAHLDIKPQNLVLTGKFPDCDVKLCDFGISRYLSQGVDVREILGTPDYVAPEVLNYEPISLATDMWSVGVLLYVLLTGCSPFGGDTKQETFCNITQCRLDFPDDIFEDISEDAKDLMRKLMVKNPSKRLSATACLQHPWFTNPRPSSSLSSSAALNSLSIGATTPRTPTLSKRPAPTMEHSEDRSLSTDESDSDDSETDHNSKHNTEINSNFDSNTAETAQQNTEIEPNAEEIDPTFDQDHHEDKSSTMSSCCFDCNHEHEDKSSTISSSSTLTAESCSDRCSVVGASEFGCDNVQLTTSAGLGSMSSGTTCVGTSSVRTTSAGKTSVGITSSGPSLVGTTSTGFSSLNQQQSAGPTPTGVTTKGLSEERKRSFMRNMESLVQKLSFTDTEGSLVDTHGSQKMNVNSLEGNSTYSKNINSFSNNNCSRTVCDIDLDSFVHSSSNINENKCSRFVSSSTPIHDRRGRFVDFDENNGDTSYRLSSKLNDTYTTSQYLSDSSDDSCRRFSKMNQSSGVKDSQYSSDSSDESSLRDSGFSSSKQQDDSKSSGSSDDDLRMSCCRGESSEFGDAKKGNINEATSGRTSMLRDSWYRDSKPSSASRFRQVDGFRNLTRASGVQTMPVSSFLHYKLDCGYNFLTRGSFGYESGDESVFKFRRVFILDDSEDRLSPPPSFNGSLSSDNSISDSNSDTISEMSIDSSSDRSSIISLDDSLDFVYGKSLGQARHYSTSCYNVWEAVKTQGPTSRSRVCPRECHGSFARALSKFTGSTESSELKEGNFHRQRKSLTIFNGYNTSASTSRSSTPPINKKCIGLELMREHNGNVVVIREVKAVHGSKFPRCSEVKCESVQSRIRRLQVQNGIRTELAKERYNVF